jgi:large subunit ribosomal protein LP0
MPVRFADETFDIKNLPRVTLPGLKVGQTVRERKMDYGMKLRGMLEEYDKLLVMTVDNVGSRQLGIMRKRFRGRARFLFGKNTMIRKVIREYVKETSNGRLMALMDLVRGNSGFVFTKGDIASLRKALIEDKVQCAAKAGSTAPDDVFVEAGPTGMEPTQTTFFQSMNIPTRINKGQIDISERVHLMKKDSKIGLSEAQLLSQLNVRPFYYGVKVVSVYDNGDCYDAAVLDLTDEDIASFFYNGLRRVAALSFTIDYPNITMVPHAIFNAYKKMLALGLSLDAYSWENLALVKEMLANPDAFAAPAAVADGGAVAAAAAVEEEEEEAESSVAAANPFGDDESSEESSD